MESAKISKEKEVSAFVSLDGKDLLVINAVHIVIVQINVVMLVICQMNVTALITPNLKTQRAYAVTKTWTNQITPQYAYSDGQIFFNKALFIQGSPCTAGGTLSG